MGQPSIPMLNKVGYSMYWGSMWDNKIIFSRLLKEDIYLNQFFDLIFSDDLSKNIFNLKKQKKKKTFFFNFSKNPIFKRNNKLLVKIKTNFFNSKVWILKYQNWVIVYNFVFLKKFNFNFKNLKNEKNLTFKKNFSYLFYLYNKINKNLKISYKMYRKNKNTVF